MTGILASVDLTNGPNQAIYVNNKDAAAVATISIVNRNPSRIAKIRVAISSSESPAGTDWVEYDTEIEPRGVLERTGLWVNPDQFIVVRSNLPNVNAVVWGATKGNINLSAPGLTPVTAGTVTWSTSATLTQAPLSVPYRLDLVANDSNGGTVFYSLASGSSLPPGIGLSTTGVLEGTPTTSGSYSFTITASNGTNSSNRAFSLTVNKVTGTSVEATVTTAGGYTSHTYSNTTGSFTATAGGLIEIYVWGGGGAGGTPGGWSFGAPGGAGGYSSGVYRIASGETIHVRAGSGGAVNSTSEVLGGGGIASLNLVDNRYGSGGGGYSGVFFRNTFQQQDVLIMAGGGGGGGSSRAGTGNQGGGGGGLTGQDGVSAYDGKTGYRGRGATQLVPGGNADSDADNIQGGAPTALRGGSPRVNSYGGAGGGGYWGGSAGGYSEPNTMGGGGGGSGYLHPQLLQNGFTEAGNLTTPGGNNALRGTFGNAGGVSTNGTAGGIIIRYIA